MAIYVKPQMLEARRDPGTGLWCREDGAVLLPPAGIKFREFRWTFGSLNRAHSYRNIRFNGKKYGVHRLVCGAFHGPAPADKSSVDHINRIKDDNHPCNLHWVDNKENQANQASVDKSIEMYGVRSCDDKKAYMRAYNAAKRAKKKAQGMHHCKGPNGKWGWYPKELT